MPPVNLSDDNDAYIDGDGKRYVRISRVLQQNGVTRDYSGADPFYRDRGRAVHHGIDLLNRGTLDWNTLDEHTLPFLKAYKSFLGISGFEPVRGEVALGSVHGFAGTIDLLGMLKGRFVLIDAKTGESVDRAVEQQTGGYEILWNENHPEMPIEERYYLQLRENEKFSLKSLSQVPAWSFLATYYDWRWKQRLSIPECPPAWPFKRTSFTRGSKISTSEMTPTTDL